MKTYFKTLGKMFGRHATRLVSITLMLLVSIGFSAGIGMATDKIDDAIDGVYHAQNVSDLIVKSTREDGFTEEEAAALTARFQDGVLFGSSLEFQGSAMRSESEVTVPLLPAPVPVTTEIAFEGTGDGVTKAYFFDGTPEALAQNVPELSDVAPDAAETFEEDGVKVYPVYVERPTAQLKEYPLGTRLTATVTTVAVTPFGEQRQETRYRFRVVGILTEPLHLAVRKDVSLQFEEEGDPCELESVFYLFGSDLSPAPRGNDAYIALEGRDEQFAMSAKYKTFTESAKAEAEALVPDAAVLTLFENFSFASFHEYGEKIAGIGYVMTTVFLFVTVLVVLSTMTRLLEEERAQIACLMTLGYSPMRIISKYLLFALVGTLIGGAGAFAAGQGLAYIVYINFTWNFTLPPYPKHVSPLFFLLVAAAMLVATLFATFLAGFRMTRIRPAVLLRPKTPRPGKKVIFERIPFLWNRLSFKHKSTLRNVLRFKTRFLMTVVSVMCSTALVLAGLAVLDCCIFQEIGTAAMIGVAIIVLLFAALLNFVVVYTLTNINISERNRELATLMVLGYYDNEVTGYIYREVYLTSAIGIALGVPAGCLLCLFVFEVMGFGSIPGIGWYVWLVAPLLSLFFVFAVTVLLRRRIVRIHMNESLKAIE